MIRWFAIFAFALLLGAPSVAHAALACDAGPAVPVAVTPEFDTPRYDTTRDLAGIQSIASDRRHSIPQYHEIALGITRYEPVLEFRVALMFESEPGEPGCAHLKKIGVKVGYRNVTVFIAHEVAPDSCGYRETLAHEEKHITVNRELLDEYVPLIEERFRAYAELNSAFRAQDSETAKAMLDEKLNSIINEMSEKMETENVRRQREIDSAEEYDRLAHVCNGDLSRIAGRFHPPPH